MSVRTKIGPESYRTLYSNARHKCLYGGRGSGKSYAAATYLTLLASQTRKKIVCARQFQNSIRDSSKALIDKRIHDLELTEQFVSTNTDIVNTETGSSFIFVGLERNVESIRSLEGADVVWVEEARTINARSLEVLLPTVRAQGSELIWTWNPLDPSDPVDKYFRGGEPPLNSIVTKIDYTDNPYFHETALPLEMAAMQKNNPARVPHVWHGEYDLSYETRVYPNVRMGRLNISPGVPPRYGMDLGFSVDPSAVIKIYALTAARKLYVAAEACGRVTMDELPSLLASVVSDPGDLVKVDSSQPGTIEFLRSRGFGVIGARKGQHSVREGVLFLQGFEWVVAPECPMTYDELRRYTWPTDKLTGIVTPGVNPIGGADHLLDLARYCLEDLILSGSFEEGDDGDGGVMWIDLWNRGPRLRRADPPAGPPVPRDKLLYTPLPPRQPRAD